MSEISILLTLLKDDLSRFNLSEEQKNRLYLMIIEEFKKKGIIEE